MLTKVVIGRLPAELPLDKRTGTMFIVKESVEFIRHQVSVFLQKETN